MKNVSPTVVGSGSGQINSALENILSSDNNVENTPELLHDTPAAINPVYTLGSESLNRMLEEILSPNLNAKIPYIAPAQQL